MKASVRWLRELCPQLPDDALAIAARLTAAGLEVEATHAFGLGAEACVVASVVSTRPHPSRSGLRLVTVDRGGGTQLVVCGAPNVPEPGGLVVLAPFGAYLPAKGMTIEPRTIAGVPSEGMLCSEAELGLTEKADASDGILVLPPGAAAAGVALSRALPAVRDTVLEIGLTPNRPDGLGHVGLAREAAALFDVPFELRTPAGPEVVRPGARTEYPTVTIEDGDRCPHYGATVLVNTKVGPSPLDVRWRLASLGVRSISNVVDVTNLVMLEFGHPTHAFDLDRVRGSAIVVRRARPGEKLRTLDGIDRALVEDDLVICDADGPVALAGVMGGGESEIAATTQRVLVECAYFDPRGIRRTSRRHNLHTESSHRFERGVDWGDTGAVLARAGSLLSTLADAVTAGPAEVTAAKPLARRTVSLRHDRVSELLGVHVDPGETRGILGRLGFERRPAPDSGGAGESSSVDVWEAPSFRPDVSREVDLVEEVARLRGYDAIPTKLPAIQPSRDAAPRQAVARRARQAGVAMGLSEVITYSFVNPRDLTLVGAPAPAVTLLNPMSEDQAAMRTSLLPGLIRAFAHARRRGERNVRSFTVGAVFLGSGGVLPDERLGFAALIAGDRPGWLTRPEALDVWDAKGLAEGFVARMLRREVTVHLAADDSRPPALHPRGAAWVEVGGKRVGSFGPLHPDVTDGFDVGEAMVIEFDLGTLQASQPEPIRFEPLPRFPASMRDLAVVVRDNVPAGDVEHAVRDAAGELAERVTLFDRFVGGSILPGHASLALHVVYRSSERTLTDSEVDTRHAQVLAAVEQRFGATLRS